MRSRVVQVLLSVSFALASSAPALAQGTARSQDIDTSIRAAGMGGASVGVWWGEPGVWGNAASLAEVNGIGWVEGRTQLVPGLASDVRFNTRRLLLGGAGLGVSLMGDPIEGLGRARLDYGSSQGFDPFGNPTGTYESREDISAWGLGLSPIQLVDAFRRLAGFRGVPASQPVDFAFGVQRKHTTVALAPGFGAAEADCLDWGMSARVSLLPWIAPEAPLHLDVSGGYAVLNANDATFDFGLETAPPSRIRRRGFALHASLPSPWSSPGAAAPIWLLAGELHAVEVGMAVDDEDISAGGAEPSYKVSRFGLEITALGMLTGRVGHVTDRLGDITDNTYGFGVRLPVGPWASIAYDRASVPQASGAGLPRVIRQGWSAWVDPLEILRRDRDTD